MAMRTRFAVITAVIVLLIVIGGGYYLFSRSKFSPTTYKTPESTQTTSVFTSIQEALSKSLSVQCAYTDNSGKKVVAYIKNGMVRSDITDTKDQTQSGSVILKDKKIYYWNAQKIGFMMAMPEVSVTPSVTVTQQQNTGENTLQSLEQYKQYCHVATVADTVFVIPTDVKFTDTSKIMQMMPTGVPTGNTNAQQQMEQYMQQYHITPQQ